MAKYKSEISDLNLELEIDSILDKIETTAINQLKAKAPKRTGKYASSFVGKKEDNAIYIYSKEYHSIVHLLEFGTNKAHPQPHFRPVFNSVEKEAVELFKNINIKEKK